MDQPWGKGGQEQKAGREVEAAAGFRWQLAWHDCRQVEGGVEGSKTPAHRSRTAPASRSRL